MIDAPHGVPPRISPPPIDAAAAPRDVPGLRSGLGLDLHELAEDLAGPVDRDELTSEEAAQLADLLDEVVLVTMPRVAAMIADELGPRIESLPLHARVVLANARVRRSLGPE